MSTPERIKQVAQWMVKTLREQGEIYQDEVADTLHEKFSEEFVYENENGNWGISKAVLKEFRKLTEGWVKWEPSGRYWRLREKGEGPGRKAD